VDRVHRVLNTPQGWVQQQSNRSIIAFRQRWREVHNLFALGSGTRYAARVEVSLFIKHLLPSYQDLVTQWRMLLDMASADASGTGKDARDIDSLVQFLTKEGSDSGLSAGQPAPTLDYICRSMARNMHIM
jgi:hypothetical protein